MTILFVGGVNDRSQINVTLNSEGQLRYVMDGNCSVFDRLQLESGLAYPYLLFGENVMQPRVNFRSEPTLIFNQIADADTHRGALNRCIELCDQINTTVINHPRQVLKTTRDQVAETLKDLPGVTVPRTLRFQPRSPGDVLERAAAEAIEFPFIIRVAGDHNGENMVRLKREEDLPAMHPLPFDGRDFYLVEFIDYRDEAGLYHKQRIVVLDGEPFLRHALYWDQWKVHAEARDFMMKGDTWEDDIERFRVLKEEVLPKARPAIDEMTRRLELDYYGIDCCLRPDGHLIVFEANANMNVLFSPNEAARYRVDAIEKKLYEMLQKFSGERVVKADTPSVV